MTLQEEFAEICLWVKFMAAPFTGTVKGHTAGGICGNAGQGTI